MTTRGAGEFTGRHMVFVSLGFFGVIISVNIGMAVVASTSWTGLVVKNSYVASQEFEERRLAHEAQRAAGWSAVFTHEGGRATLRVVDGAGVAVDLGEVQLTVNRPVGGHDDQLLELERQADGTYASGLVLPSGIWDAHLEAPDTVLGPFELYERFAADGRTQ